MAANGLSNMHNDAWMSDAYAWAGPQSDEAAVKYIDVPGMSGQCPTHTFFSTSPEAGAPPQSYMLALCVKREAVYLILFSASLRELARHELPPRPSSQGSWVPDFEKISRDTSGVYLYLDRPGPETDLPRAVVAAADHTIRVVQVKRAQNASAGAEQGSWSLEEERRLDVNALLDDPRIARIPDSVDYPTNPVTAALPDAAGNLWFVTRYGALGVFYAEGEQAALDVETPQVSLHQIGRSATTQFEEVQNGFAVGVGDKDIAHPSIYLVSDRALYRFYFDKEKGEIAQDWRKEYDNEKRRKPGMIHAGSGTTPTLFGEGDASWVTIADNAPGQVHVLVHERATGQLVCEVPVFALGESAAENSLIALGRSIVVENNYGWGTFRDFPAGKPGLWRIDVESEGKDCAREQCCRVAWKNDQIATSAVSKLALGGPRPLIYSYTYEELSAGAVDWYLTAVFFDSGTTAFRIRVGGGDFFRDGVSIPQVLGIPRGPGAAFNNNFSAISIAPDASTYVGVFEGLVRIAPSTPVDVRSPLPTYAKRSEGAGEEAR